MSPYPQKTRGKPFPVFCAAAVFFYCSAPVFADEPKFADLPGGVLRRTGMVFTAPARLTRTSAASLAALTGAGYLLYSMDGGIRRGFRKNRSSLNDRAGDILEKLGDGGYEIGFISLYGAAGGLFGKPGMIGTAVLAAESFAAANAAGSLVKISAGRARPYAKEGKGVFRPFKNKTAHTSFPSGHTTSVFSVASVFAVRSESVAVSVAAYLLASGAALQRIYADKHWASDVFAGAALGTAVGRAVAGNGGGKKEKTACLLPFFTGAGTGAAAVFRF